MQRASQNAQSAANIARLDSADGVIANLRDFRGTEPDAGTVFEVGYAHARGIPVIGYGVPMTEKSASDPQHFPDTVWLFRRAILDEWAARGDVTLGALVAHVVIHEFAHHFGWSDEDIATIDKWWE